ncbi:MAG: Transcriptional regulator, GntR family protein [Rhizobacter sp.]|nr:Transcriptional regulator, GntR family protein [Rhizobacter sp.]
MHDSTAEPGKPTLAEVVYERLKQDIFDFRMAPGQRYAEQELANRLGVSRTPLRFALHILAREGYLQRAEGHTSWQVRPFDLGYFEDLYDFRVEIEVLAVRRLCKMDSLPDLAALCDFWRVAKRQRVLDGQSVAREDEKLHTTLVALAGSREMLRTYTDLTERIRIVRRLDFIEPSRIQAAFDEHDKILAAVLARRAGEAEMLIRAHIGASRAAIRHISLHRLALATEQGRENAAAANAR